MNNQKDIKKIDLGKTLEHLKKTIPLEEKINIFEEHIKNFQIGFAQDLLNKKIENSGLAIITILFTYFENIGKYREGYTNYDRVGEFCKKGLEWVFPDINSWGDDLTTSFLNKMYTEGRCGIYHTTYPGYGILLRDNLVHPIELDKEEIGTREDPIIVIDYTKLPHPIALHFERYISMLRDVTNDKLRESFETRFDSIYFKSSKD